MEHQTLRDIKHSAPYVVALPMTLFSQLENKRSPFAYNSGVYGWNLSAVRLTEEVVVVGGYRQLDRASRTIATAEQQEEIGRLLGAFEAFGSDDYQERVAALLVAVAVVLKD